MRFILKFIVFSYGLISGPGYAAAPLDTVTSKLLHARGKGVGDK